MSVPMPDTNIPIATDGGPIFRKLMRQVCGPALVIVLAVALLIALHTLDASQLAMGNGTIGPTTWPTYTLVGIVLFSGLMLAARCRKQFLRARSDAADGANAAPAIPKEELNNLRLALGLIAIMLYGPGIAYIGFAFSTAAFLFLWLIITGTNRLRTLVGVSGLGTIGLVYMFIKVAYTPLPRGVGVFDQLTLSFYRLLGIF